MADPRRSSVRLSVHDFGGRGPDLLLIHGLASTRHIFDLVAPMLAEEFRIVAYDQRGHGESAKPSSHYGFDYVAGDAARVIRDLELDRPIVLGHSWGANVVLELGVREPSLVSGLILLDGGFGSIRARMDWQTTKQTLAPPSIAGTQAEDFRRMLRQFLSADMEVTPEIEAITMSLMRVGRDGSIRPRLTLANHLRVLRALWEQDAIALLRRVKVPTWVVATRPATVDAAGKAFLAVKEGAERQVRDIGGNVRFEWIDGIHDVPLQHPDAVADLIRRFSGQLLDRAASSEPLQKSSN